MNDSISIKQAVELLEQDGLLVGYDCPPQLLEHRFSHLSYSSADVTPDTFFICKGAAFKEEYLRDAIAKGAGVYLAQSHPTDMIRRAGLYKVALSRLFIAPLVTLALLSLLPASMLDMKLAILIAQACPVGLNVAVYAQLHDADYVYAVETVVVSVLVSLVSIPLVVGLAQLVW